MNMFDFDPCVKEFNIEFEQQGPPGPKGDQGEPGEGVPAGGTTNQVLTKKSDADYDTEWADPQGGGGGAVNDVYQNGSSVLGDDGIARVVVPSPYDDTAVKERLTTIEGKESGWDAKYSKPSGGIPKADLASAVQTSLGKADNSLQSGTASLADLTDDSTHRVVTDSQISTWNSKATSASVTAVSNRVTTIEGKESGWDAKLSDAPIDGKQYARQNGGWSEVTGGGGGTSGYVVEADWVNNPSGPDYQLRASAQAVLNAIYSAAEDTQINACLIVYFDGGFSQFELVSVDTDYMAVTFHDMNGKTVDCVLNGSTWSVEDGVPVVTDVKVNGTSVLSGTEANVTVPTDLDDLTGFTTKAMVVEYDDSTPTETFNVVVLS